MVKRVFLYVIGIFVLAFGLVLNSKAGLGVSPIISVAYSASEISGITFGMCTCIEYIILVIIELLLYRKLDVWVVLQIPFSYAFGLLMDVYSALIPINDPPFVMGIIILLIAILATALGAFLMVSMQLITNPGDGYVNAISETLHTSFGKTKLCVDASMIIITLALSLAVKHKILGIGIGTLIACLLTGPCINMFDHFFGRRLANIVIASKKKKPSC